MRLMKFITAIFLVQILFTQLFCNFSEEVLFISKLYEDGYYDMALREIAKIEPQLAQNDRLAQQVLAIKADILTKRGEFQESRRILTRLNSQTLAPSLKAQVILSLATLENALGNSAEAINYANIFIRDHHDHPRLDNAYQLLGDIYFSQGNFEASGEVYANLHRRTKNSTTLLNLIKQNAAVGRMEIAQNGLNQHRKDYPREHSDYQQGLLVVLTVLERNLQYDRIVQLVPDSLTPKTPFTESIILKRISAHISLRQFDQAQALLSQISENPRQVSYYRAVIHKEKGEDNLALPIFRTLSNLTEAEHRQIRTMSFFNMVQIISKTNTDEAYKMLQDFLVENPDQPWEGDILYQLGFIEFQKGNFDKAYSYITKSLTFNLNQANLQNAYYLKGELEFQMQKYSQALNTFTEHGSQIAAQFTDEVVFKIGACYFFLNQRDAAYRYFNMLVSEHPNSQKLGIAYYYMGETYLFRNTAQAKTYYLRALSGEMDTGVIQLRLAYSEYLLNDHRAALERLNQVPDTKDYMFDKYLLKGNILFAQREQTAALEAYRTAERNAQDQVSVEYVWSRQAWTHYNLRQYDIASQIYRRLSQQSATPERYVLSAAGAAFNADNFEQAKEIYLEFIQNNPTSTDISRARIGLANSYFNIGDLEKAIETWRLLVHENESPSIVESALRGLQIGYERLRQIPEFTEFLNIIISRSRRPEFIITLFEFKARFEYDQKNYNAAISTINQLFRLYPAKQSDLNLQILLANNHTWLNQYEAADQIYIKLTETNQDPFIYFEWGHIKLAQKDHIAAIRRYKRAADNSQNEQYWLTLLEQQVIYQDNEFTKYYNQFMSFAGEYHRTLARMILIDWQIKQKSYTQALSLIDEVMNTSHTLLRARANFKRGEIFYLMGNFEDALSSFMRNRYVFSEFTDIRWQAEFFVAKIYVAQGDRERGRNHFNSILQYLSPEQINEFNSLR